MLGMRTEADTNHGFFMTARTEDYDLPFYSPVSAGLSLNIMQEGGGAEQQIARIGYRT
jgi:hypothetical protein